MTTQEINILLQRYEQATTTEAEETQLRQLASQGLLPDDWNAFFTAMDQTMEAPDGLEQRLSRRIDAWQASEHLRRNHWWRHVAGVAATVAILLTVGVWAYDYHQTEVLLNRDTYTDPQTAYNQTEQVLTLLADQLNKGNDGMQALELITQKLK